MDKIRHAAIVAELSTAVARAEAALAGGKLVELETAARALTACMADASDLRDASQLVARARALQAQLEATVERLAAAAIPPCPACGRGELLVSRNGALETLPLRVTWIVCRACGELRLRCDDIEEAVALKSSLGEPYFRAVSVPPAEHPPYR